MTNANGMKQGLTGTQVKALQAQYGKNELIPRKKESFFHQVLHINGEPMFLLLVAAAVIYFILGEPRDGAIMLVFVLDSPLNGFLKLAPLSAVQVLTVLGVACVSLLWYGVVKLVKHLRRMPV